MTWILKPSVKRGCEYFINNSLKQAQIGCIFPDKIWISEGLLSIWPHQNRYEAWILTIEHTIMRFYEKNFVMKVTISPISEEISRGIFQLDFSEKFLLFLSKVISVFPLQMEGCAATWNLTTESPAERIRQPDSARTHGNRGERRRLTEIRGRSRAQEAARRDREKHSKMQNRYCSRNFTRSREGG